MRVREGWLLACPEGTSLLAEPGWLPQKRSPETLGRGSILCQRAEGLDSAKRGW